MPSVLYGRDSLNVALPRSCRATIVEKPQMSFLPAPAESLAEALTRGCGDESLSALARKAKSACILICDITRPVPNGLILPQVVRTLLNSGISAADICVLVATGLHRPNLGDELRELIGDEWVLNSVQVENHDANDLKAHHDFGKTSTGTAVRLDRRFVSADLKIVTGLVEPHFMAGYSGGRKVIAPGIAHADTIRTFHNTHFMENPEVRNCNLERNLLHREQVEIVRMLGKVFAVNTCLDAQRRVAFINFGEILASHAEAVAFIQRFAEAPVAKRFRCVISSAAGYPLDRTYYQTIKGIVGALGILEKGGSLLIASECSEGFGSRDFLKAQSMLVSKGVDGFLAAARTRPLANVDEWQTVKLVEAIRDHRVHVFTNGLNPEEQSLSGVTCHGNWTHAVNTVLAESNTSELAIIPEGPYVIPFSTQSSA
jgi:lactate racemase